MKRIPAPMLLAPILLLTFLCPALAFGETMDDLVKRDGLYYKKYTDAPFTGKTMGKSQGSYRDGKLDGQEIGSCASQDFNAALLVVWWVGGL